jgi:hypothetical protein
MERTYASPTSTKAFAGVVERPEGPAAVGGALRVGHWRSIRRGETRSITASLGHTFAACGPACGRNDRDLPSWLCEFDSRHPLQ